MVNNKGSCSRGRQRSVQQPAGEGKPEPQPMQRCCRRGLPGERDRCCHTLFPVGATRLCRVYIKNYCSEYTSNFEYIA